MSMDAAEVREIEGAKAGDQEALLALWVRHAGYTHMVVAFYYPLAAQNDFEDYQQAGFIGLMAAVRTFDFSRGVNFLTWYGWQLKKHIQEAMCDGVVRVPRSDLAHRGRMKPATLAQAKAGRNAWHLGLGEVDFGMLHEFGIEDRGQAAVDGAEEWAKVEARVAAIMENWRAAECAASDESAIRCRRPDRVGGRRRRTERAAALWTAVVLARLRGYTLADAGRRVGVTRERARQIVEDFITLAAEYNRRPGA